MKINMVNGVCAYPLLLLLCCVFPASPLAAAPADLVLLVVVDQLRADMPERLHERFEPGGFRYLMDQGVRYRNARFHHANSITAAGHATLATGGNAAQHGMVANEWYDRSKGRPVNCVEDERYGETGRPVGPGEGRSPLNLASSTFGDELVLASAGRSRVFSVSIKDRSAIILGGHLGKAYWYSEETGRFTNSEYYYQEFPGWVRDWNAAGHAERYAGATWALLLAPDAYLSASLDDRPYELAHGSLGRTFPHPLPSAAGPLLYDSLPYTPMGDELTLSFVDALMRAEQPGQRGSTDVLAVSFSATDYIGHAFGPFSLEAEDNLVRLDRILAQLLRLVDEAVGLDRTLVVLASDHGVAAIPEYLAAKGVPAARHDSRNFMSAVNRAVSARFGTREILAPVWSSPAIYLDLEAVARLGLSPGEVERAVAAEIMKIPGFRMALTRSDLLAGSYPDTPAAHRVAAAFFPPRAGDVIVVPEAFWYLSAEPYGSAATHGTPYAYDTLVPIMFAGPGIEPAAVDRTVAPRDVAPTLSAFLGIAPPSGSVGEPLVEVLH
jgi:predicted AlkP superfamily pyrophosphatase or phosphodiesterase